MANAAKQLNRAGRSHAGYFSRPISLEKIGGERPCASKRAIASMIRGYSKNGKPFESTYDELAERGHFSRATAARGIRWVRDNDLFERGEKVYQYFYKGEIPEREEYVLIFEWLYFAEFAIGEKKFHICLTPTQVEILSYIRRYSPNGLSATQNYIAHKLGISKSTVSEAIRVLEAVGAIEVIYEEGHDRAENGYMRTIFRSKEKLLSKKRAEVVKREKGKSEAVKAADKVAERNTYYDALERAENNRIEALDKRLRQDPEYEYADNELRKLERDLGVAEAKKNYSELERLLEHRQKMKAQKLERMRLMSVSEQDFERQYNCEECRDTGERADHSFCDCWRRKPR